MKLIFFFEIKSLSISLNFWDWWWSQYQSQHLRPKTKVSVSVSIFETNIIKSQSQSQNLIPILKVSVSVSKIETGYTKSQSQSQHAKTGLAHPCFPKIRPPYLSKQFWDNYYDILTNTLKNTFEAPMKILFDKKICEVKKKDILLLHSLRGCGGKLWKNVFSIQILKSNTSKIFKNTKLDTQKSTVFFIISFSEYLTCVPILNRCGFDVQTLIGGMK